MTDITAAPFTYTATTKAGTAITTAGKIIDGHVGVVMRSDGVEVWRHHTIYSKASASRLQANRAVGAFRAHYAREGACWYDQRQAKQRARKAWNTQRLQLVIALEKAAKAGVDDFLAHNPDGTRKPDAGPPAAPERFATKAEWQAFCAGFDAARALPPEPEKA